MNVMLFNSLKSFLDSKKLDDAKDEAQMGNDDYDNTIEIPDDELPF